jgi:hypothetical protein
VSGTGALLLVAAIGLAALIAGRLFLGGFGGELFRKLDAAGAAAALAVGTAELTLLSVTLSGVGFPTTDLVALIAALQLVPLALAARRRRLDALRPRGDIAEWAALALPIAVTAVLGLLPVIHADGFSFSNDTYTYAAFSEWLQHRAFSETARWEAQSPVTGIPFLYQSQHYDLGIAHWLALVQAAVRPASALLVYPSTSVWALVLLVTTFWLATRQLLRLGRAWAAVVALVVAAVPHALYWGHHNGFLQQGYALPLVVFGLVLLARCTPARWGAGSAVLLALPFAFLVSVYLPLVPLFAFAAATAFVPMLLGARRRGQLRRLATFLAAIAACVALFSTRDLASALMPLHGFATSVAGGHIPWSAADFLEFALGTRVLAPGWVNVDVAPWSMLNRAMTPLYAALVVAGLWHAARRPRTRPLAAAAGLVALGALYFALAVKDPWSGERGHTWNLFKLAQWGWPFAFLLAVLAARRLAPQRPSWRIVALALAALVPASQIGVHWPWSTRFGEAMREILPGATLEQLPALKQRVQDLPPGTLLLVGRPVNANRWLATAVSLSAYPRAVVGDWTDSASSSVHPDGGEALYAQMLTRWDDPRVVPIVAGLSPFPAVGFAPLDFGFARILSGPEPRILHVVNPSGIDGTPGAPSFLVGKGRTKLVVFAPAGGAATLDLTLRPYSGRPGTRLVAFLAGGDYSHRSVRLAAAETPVAQTRLSGDTALRIALELPRGLCTVVLVVDEGRGELDAREPVTVVGLRLSDGAAAASR